MASPVSYADTSTAHGGEGRARGFAQVDGVELGALKVADDGTDLVVRLVERHGSAAQATVTLPWPFEWQETDLLEEGAGPWSVATDGGAGWR